MTQRQKSSEGKTIGVEGGIRLTPFKKTFPPSVSCKKVKKKMGETLSYNNTISH